MQTDMIRPAITVISFIAIFRLTTAHSSTPTDKSKMAGIPIYRGNMLDKIGIPVVDLKAGAEDKSMQTGQGTGVLDIDRDKSSDKNVSREEIEYCYLNLEEVPVVCDKNHHCCGYGRMERQCCPNLSAGAIFGIISSVVFISIVFASLMFGCCIWFECTALVRPKGRKKSSLLSVTQSSVFSQDLGVMETDFSGPDKDRRSSSLKDELETKEEQTNFGYGGDNTDASHLLLALPQQTNSCV